MAVHTVYASNQNYIMYDRRQIDTGSDDGTDPTAGTWYNCVRAKTISVLLTINGSVSAYSVDIYYKTAGNWEQLKSVAFSGLTDTKDFQLDFESSAEAVYIRVHTVTGVGGEVYLDVTVRQG